MYQTDKKRGREFSFMNISKKLLKDLTKNIRKKGWCLERMFPLVNYLPFLKSSPNWSRNVLKSLDSSSALASLLARRLLN